MNRRVMTTHFFLNCHTQPFSRLKSNSIIPLTNFPIHPRFCEKSKISLFLLLNITNILIKLNLRSREGNSLIATSGAQMYLAVSETDFRVGLGMILGSSAILVICWAIPRIYRVMCRRSQNK
jgi:hypothetical protein